MEKTFFTMTELERRGYLKEHFKYEVDMLFFSIHQAIIFYKKVSVGDNSSRPYAYMALEDFLLHAKILLEFFYDFGKSQKSSYISAWHFYENLEEYKKILPPKTEPIKLVERRVNNELSHLGANRISGVPPEKGWSLDIILHDFMSLVKIFVDNLPEKYFSDSLRNY